MNWPSNSSRRKIRNFAEKLRQVLSFTRKSKDYLEMLKAGTPGRLILGLDILESVLSYVEVDNYNDVFEEIGLVPISQSGTVDKILTSVLRQSGIKTHVEDIAGTKVCLYGAESIYDKSLVAARVADSDYADIVTKDQKEFIRKIAEVFWSNRGSNIELRTSIRDDESLEIGFQDAAPCGMYSGSPSPEEIYNNICSVGSGTTVLMGPTGAGKSTLARHIAKMFSGDHRVLSIANSVGASVGVSETLRILEFVNPDILILDDVNLDHPWGSNIGHFISFFETLRHKVKYSFVTTMVDEDFVLEPGSLYSPGMRPGRIDEFVLIGPPNEEKRRAVIQLYNSSMRARLDAQQIDEIAEKTEGLMPAYLRAIVERVKHRGFDCLDKEIFSLRLQAPVFNMVDKDKEEDDE